jgi:hypothetical protein
MDHVAVNAHHAQPCRHRDWLVGYDPNLAGELSHLHRKAHRGVHGSDSPVFQRLNHAAGNVVDLFPAVVKFEIGDRSSRSPDGLSIHANHEADERLGMGERLEDVFALIVQSGSADLDKPHVIRTSIKDQLFQPCGIQRLLLGRNGWYDLEANTLHGRVIFEFHGQLSVVCN